jgi:hypothetical protein
MFSDVHLSPEKIQDKYKITPPLNKKLQNTEHSLEN